MKYSVYSIKDLKTGFLPPTVEMNDQSAIRNFEHACSNTQSLFFTHPGDYQFWRLGTYDTDTGELTSDPVFLIDAPNQKEGV